MPEVTGKEEALLSARALAERGKLAQALRYLKRNSIPQADIVTFVTKWMNKAVSKNQFGMLLTFLHDNPEFQEVCPTGVQEILKELYESKDYSGFLKQTFRFQLTEIFESHVSEAIEHLLASGQVESANSYQLRLRKIAAPNGSTNHSLASAESCDLCDKTLKVLRRFNTNVTRHQQRHACEFRIAKKLSATVYHLASTLRVYINAAPENLDLLLEMAEFGQIRTVYRRDPEKIKFSKRPLIAMIRDHNDVELVAPIVAYANSFKNGVSEEISSAPDYSVIQAVAQKTLPETMMEGRRKEHKIEFPERNPKARAACLASQGLTCKACNLNFHKFYGILGNGFIHVHHVDPLYVSSAEREVDPITDLVPVCPNCHAMLHRRIPPYSIEELKRMIKIAKDAHSC